MTAELSVGTRILTEDTTELRDDYRKQRGYVAEIQTNCVWVVFDNADLNTNEQRTDRAMYLLDYESCLTTEDYLIQELLP